MKFLRSHLLAAGAAATVTTVVLGGMAWATIPNNMNGDITACVRAGKPDKGSVRIIDRQDGRACHKGEDMVTWSTRGFKWRGQWNRTAKYKTNDVVGYNGSSWIAKKGTTNILPSSTGYWSLMTAAGGGQGAAGQPGATGPSGATGATGPTGPSGVAVCSGYPHTGIDWNGCDLTGANLNNAGFTNANLANALLAGANLNTAHLPGANLTGATLTTADLTNADLTGANLTNANLTGATQVSTVYTGATFLNTICPDGSNSDAHSATCVGFP